MRNFISMEGLGTVDILYGTYYTVIPVVHPGSVDGDQTHAILAIDVSRSLVLTTQITPLRLISLNVNSLFHTLYGMGQDVLAGMKGSDYSEVFRSSETTQTVSSGGLDVVYERVGESYASLRQSEKPHKP